MLQTDVIRKAGIAESGIRQLQTAWDAWQNAQDGGISEAETAWLKNWGSSTQRTV